MLIDDAVITVIVTTLVVLLLIAGVILTMVLANRRHVKREADIVHMQLEHERDMRSLQNDIQEQTLTKIARELHDNIGQLLTFISIQLEQQKLESEDYSTNLTPVTNTLEDTIEQVRLLSHSLNTDFLKERGLIGAIRVEVERLSGIKSISFDLQLPEEIPAIDNQTQITIFRIFQELINNIIKYAKAKNVDIAINTDDGFYMHMHDDGRGFNVGEALNKGSGLTNIISRSKLIGMSFEIDSVVGKGSTFTLKSVAS